ncbi:methylthioribulose 1-phosphate dehydratase [Marinomonas sp. 15G1-11]|uniref:Methylthioribulose-1-phosphate dehydratase n=1 Tax=Marinomonas phaeophyticola TaxID=3004091 RepID=A0ABT4JVX5_9GAMM|nr:methylthioribulose 1-phosphate dehydratase [Marinomonas sp. 15G1-11]MCZ2722532.1 methylthioribulose 1-phosphate dehydratase [Marinomonas sp. 15G1-11]
MTTELDNQTLALSQAIILAGKWISGRQWVPATGGNFSARLDKKQCLVTASGKHKGHLCSDDLLTTSWTDQELICDGKPSAETLLHTQIYDLDESAQAVFHTHSVQATVFSRLIDAPSYRFNGYEMQKSITGNTSHADDVRLPIVNNSQDMRLLAAEVKTRWQDNPMPYAFLVKGHGMYAWGDSIETAKHHLEGWEFLIECELKRIQLLPLLTDHIKQGNGA